MKITQENKVMHWIQTILLSVCTTGIVFCLKFLWAINGYIEQTRVRDDVQDASISSLRTDFGLAKKDQENLDKRVVYIEAILPSEEKKRKR